jgi:hypothetical protein
MEGLPPLLKQSRTLLRKKFAPEQDHQESQLARLRWYCSLAVIRRPSQRLPPYAAFPTVPRSSSSQPPFQSPGTAANADPRQCYVPSASPRLRKERSCAPHSSPYFFNPARKATRTFITGLYGLGYRNDRILSLSPCLYKCDGSNLAGSSARHPFPLSCTQLEVRR